ncbi:MAG: DUF5678 domain-containing protein [Candidatus Hydrothermarchaeota archaeon]|nr:DUF5678 domain-containing protein [Candidatus Hydrothermarchaeota archaeon]
MPTICLEHIDEFEKNQKWFRENFNKILKQYKEEFVAIFKERIIDHDKDLERLAGRVKAETKGAKGAYIEYVSDKPVEMIL